MTYEIVKRAKDLSEEQLKNLERSLTPVATVELDHIEREKGRLKLTSTNGEDVRVFIQRGQLLEPDELLPTECGQWIKVGLAKEEVVTASTEDWDAFSKACYHLGNRHTRIQIGERWLRFLFDPVLVELVELLGLTAKRELAEFVPESGAYAGGHSHSDTHSQQHLQEHSHSHSYEDADHSGESHDHHKDHSHDHSHAHQ